MIQYFSKNQRLEKKSKNWKQICVSEFSSPISHLTTPQIYLVTDLKLWSPTPPIWERCIWMTTTCRIQMWWHDLCIRTLFFLLSSPINHLTTPQIYLLTLWRGPTPRLGTTGLNWLTVYKVVEKTSSTSKLLTWFHFNKCSNDPIFHQKSKIREKVQKLKTDLCIRTLFFLLSSPINHLMTPQIYLVTLWRGPTPRLGTTGLN